VIQQLNAGQSLTDSFTAVSSDGTASQIVTVTINGTDDPRVIAPGEVVVLKGGVLTGPIENNGTIQTQSNNPSTILGSITGTGVIQIQNNTTLIINGSVGSGQTILFSVDPGGGANAKLVLNDPLNFHAKISDFLGNDQIDLGNFVVSSITYVDNAGTNTGGTLKIFGIFNGNGIVTEVDIIFIDGDKMTANFKFASDGNNGTTIIDPPTSTTTPEATVIPVADRSTLTATETASSQTDVSSATADDGTVAVLGASVSDPDGGETTNVTVDRSGAVAHTARIVSGPSSLMVNPGVAPEFTSFSHRGVGNLTNNHTVEVSSPPELGRTALSRDRGAVNVLEGQIALASVMLVLQFLTESFRLASDANAGTLIADPPASPDAEVAAVSETRAVKAADTADTQATAAAADEGAVAALDAAFAPDGGMLDLASSSLPADFVLPESDGDEPTATHDAISLAYSEFADHGLHGSGKDHTTAPNVATTNSAEGRVSLSSHTTSSETGSDGNSHGGDAARIHDAIAGHSSTIDTVGTTISDSASSSFRGATSGHVNDQPHFENASPGTLQSLESPTQAALHAHEGRPDHNHGAAPEHGATIDTPATTIADSDAPGLRGEPPGHVNDKVNDKAQLGNADPGNNGLGHQSHDLPGQAAAPAVEDVPLVVAGKDAKGGPADHSHGAAAKDPSTIDIADVTIADGDAPGIRGEPAGHVNDKAQSGNANPGNNGLGHQSHDLPSQASAPAAEDIPPVVAVEDAKGGRADHSQGAAAKDSSTIDTAGAAVAHTDSSGSQGAAPGDDQFHFAYTNPGTSQSTELPSQAASDPAVKIPASTTDNSGVGHGNDFNAAALPDAVEDAKGGDKAQIRGAAAKDSPTTDVAGATVADNHASSLQDAASGIMNDQFHFADGNPGNKGLGQQSVELPSQTASHAAVDIPAATTELAQTINDILTQAAQAPVDPVTTPGQDHDLAWTNAHNDKQSNHFIIHA
jgi:hypothetical protein